MDRSIYRPTHQRNSTSSRGRQQDYLDEDEDISEQQEGAEEESEDGDGDEVDEADQGSSCGDGRRNLVRFGFDVEEEDSGDEQAQSGARAGGSRTPLKGSSSRWVWNWNLNSW